MQRHWLKQPFRKPSSAMSVVTIARMRAGLLPELFHHRPPRCGWHSHINPGLRLSHLLPLHIRGCEAPKSGLPTGRVAHFRIPHLGHRPSSHALHLPRCDLRRMCCCLPEASIADFWHPDAADVHAPTLLYNLVFGESLVNDAVSIVLFRTFVSLPGASIVTVTFCVTSLTGVFLARAVVIL